MHTWHELEYIEFFTYRKKSRGEIDVALEKNVEQSNVEVVILNFNMRDYNNCRYSGKHKYVDEILVELSKLK